MFQPATPATWARAVQRRMLPNALPWSLMNNPPCTFMPRLGVVHAQCRQRVSQYQTRGMNDRSNGGDVNGAGAGYHFGGRFCQVSSLSCVFTSSLKWSKVEGPVPGIHQYQSSRCNSSGNILPSPFFGSMSGILLILRYAFCTARLNPGLRMSFWTAQACGRCELKRSENVYDAHTSNSANHGAMLQDVI